MTEIFAVGGFGSTLRQYESLADKLHEKFGPDLAISGVNFLSAIRNSEQLADRIDGKRVITHSAGAYAVAAAVQLGATPTHLDMIAPPAYDMTPRLALNAIRYEISQRRHREPSVDNMPSEKNDILLHPHAHLGVVPALGRFATLPFATICQSRETITRLGIMKHDGIFEFGRYPADELQQAVDAGVKISQIEGDHTRFTREPGLVLTELELAGDFNIDYQSAKADNPGVSITILGRLANVASHIPRRVAA